MEQKNSRKEKRNIARWIAAGRRRTIGLIIVVGLLLCAGTYAVAGASYSRYETLTIAPSSLNGNTIWGATENYSKSNLDGYGAFYSAARTSYGGLPVNGSLTVGSVPYQLANGTQSGSYDGNDSIRLTTSSPVRTIYLDTYGSYEQIYVLGTAGGPGKDNFANFKVTLTYTDGSTDVTTYRLYDWYNTDRTAGVEKYERVRRILISNGSYDGSSYGGPVLQSATIDANPSKLLKSVSFTLAGINNSSAALSGKDIYCGVYAVTGAVNKNAPQAPQITATTDIYGAGFTADWNEVSDADWYYLDVSETPDFKTFVNGYNNKKIEDTTAHIDNLKNGTRYYCRVRAGNRYGSSLSSNVAEVVTYVPNTAIVGLTLDGQAYEGQAVTLQTGSQVYTLYGEQGCYRSTKVANGTYDIYVNGKDTGRQLTFDYQGSDMTTGETLTAEIAYDTLSITTRLDNNCTSSLGDVSLVQNGQALYSADNQDGMVSIIVQVETDQDEYEIYVGEQNTNKIITAAPNASEVIDYYEMKVAVDYDRLLDDANVSLCDSRGTVIDTLQYKSAVASTAYYSKIMQKDDKTNPVSYAVYVNGQDTHQSISAINGAYETHVSFYRATVHITLDDGEPGSLQVTMGNGEESYGLTQSGCDYTNEFTLKNTAGGNELPYTVTVEQVLYPESYTMDSASATLDLAYYTVKYQLPSAGGWVQYTRQIVKSGLAAVQPSDPGYGVAAFKNWCADEELTTEYDFMQPITAPLTVYAAFREPEITINGYVKTGVDGTIDSKGQYYRMPNLKISGYEENANMKNLVLETTGCSGIFLLSDDIIESSAPLMTETDGQKKIALSGKGTVLIELKADVTMGQLQQFLRDQVVVKPKASEKHTMQITVFGE